MLADSENKINTALKLHREGQFLEAENIYTEILNNYPNNADAFNLLGLLKLQNNYPEEAFYYIQKALELKPCAYFYDSLGRVYLEMKYFNEAIKYFEKSLELEKDNFDSYFNLALAYKNNMQFDKAIEIYQTAASINPDNSSIYFNLANIFEQIGDTYKAIEYYEKAKECTKELKDKDIQYSLGVSYLKIKDFEKGLKNYEYRQSKDFAILCQTLQYKDLMTSKPLWNGEKMSDKNIFVYYESALGDTLMYCRYLHLVKDMCAKVLFKPQYCFIDLFKENNFDVQIIDSETLSENINFDAHIPLMSIPYVLGLNTENIPFSEGYLKANQKKAITYKEQYFNTDKFKIGIKWKGNTNDLSRVLPTEYFNKFFNLPNTQFYSLQKGDGIEELENFPPNSNIINLGENFKDFSDTAAAIENLDLVICNDTSVAHLAGAMGKPCSIMLPFVSNWRWYNDMSYSPWYKSVKLFKQNKPYNWEEAFNNAYEELKILLSNA
jgi:tetratricopeptide (TPR) repeat protein